MVTVARKLNNKVKFLELLRHVGMKELADQW